MRKVASLGGAAGFSHNTASGTVNLNGTRVTDGDLAVLDLGRSDILRTLDLCNTNVGDPGIKYVAQVKSLRYLYLGNTQVTDAAIPDLASLPQLGLLDLGGTRVTNAAVPEIASMRTLLWLNIENTAITSSGEEELRAAFPNIHRLKWPTRNAEQAAGNGREEKE